MTYDRLSFTDNAGSMSVKSVVPQSEHGVELLPPTETATVVENRQQDPLYTTKPRKGKLCLLILVVRVVTTVVLIAAKKMLLVHSPFLNILVVIQPCLEPSYDRMAKSVLGTCRLLSFSLCP